MSQRTRGRYGQGSIRQQPNGRWKATFSAGQDREGGRARPSRVFDTRKQADVWLTEMRQKRNLGIRQSRERQTLTQFVDWWLTNEAHLDKRESTVNHYRYAFKKYIEPRLGARFLDTIGAEEVLDLLGHLKAQGLGVQTLKRVRSYLSLFFENALGKRLVGHNPVKQVKVPKVTTADKSHKQDPLSLREVDSLFRSLKGTELEAVVTLAVYLGLRRGEILGLKWSDIDFEESTLSIERTLSEVSALLPDGTLITKVSLNPPKTRNSRRTLPLPAEVVSLLRSQRSRQGRQRLIAGEVWQDEDFVFTNGLGSALWPTNVATKFRKHLKQHGLRHIRFHDLRHTAATLMLKSGSRLEEVSQALGHSSIVITKDVYASYLPTLSNRAVETLASALRGSGSLERVVGGNPLPRIDRPRHWGGDA